MSADPYAACRSVVSREARSFKWGIRLLPARLRGPMAALYAFCRAADDAADGEESPAVRRQAVRRVRDRWEAARSGTLADDPIMTAFADAVARNGIDPADVEGLLAAVEADLVVTRYPDFPALERYADGVAGGVGRACAALFGRRDPAARDLATRMGLGMQLVNILRDVAEDARRGRVYLPLADLERHGLSAEGILAGSPGPGFQALVREIAARAREGLAAAAPFGALLAPDLRFFPETLGATYGQLLDRLERDGWDPIRHPPRLSRGRVASTALAVWGRRRLT